MTEIKTVKANEEIDIQSFRTWSAERIRSLCIDYDLFTKGDNEDYDILLSFVNNAEPDLKNTYIVAKNISEHSDNKPIVYIMYLIENHVTTTVFMLNNRFEKI